MDLLLWAQQCNLNLPDTVFVRFQQYGGEELRVAANPFDRKGGRGWDDVLVFDQASVNENTGRIEVYDTSVNPVASTAALTPGADRVLNNIYTTAGGEYRVAVSAASSETAAYTLRLTRNSVVESESHGGGVCLSRSMSAGFQHIAIHVSRDRLYALE